MKDVIRLFASESLRKREEGGDELYFPILIRHARELVRTVLRHTDSVNFMQHAADED